jgi:hypothetical protein
VAIARRAAVRSGSRNGVPVRSADVTFPESDSFAPIRVTVAVRGEARLRPGPGVVRHVAVRAKARAELSAMATMGNESGERVGVAHRVGRRDRGEVGAALVAALRAERLAERSQDKRKRDDRGQQADEEHGCLAAFGMR